MLLGSVDALADCTEFCCQVYPEHSIWSASHPNGRRIYFGEFLQDQQLGFAFPMRMSTLVYSLETGSNLILLSVEITQMWSFMVPIA